CLSAQPLKILDVRQRREWDQSHVPEKSLHVFAGDLAQELAALPKDTELWTICASGYRAAIAKPARPRGPLGPARKSGWGCPNGRLIVIRRRSDKRSTEAATELLVVRPE